MTMTRRIETETLRYAKDGSGTLEAQEITYYLKAAPDPDNPNHEMKEDQLFLIVDHTTQTPGENGKVTAGDLTAGQRSNVASGVAACKSILDRVHPLNPGPDA